MEIDIIGLLSAFSFALDCVEAELIHVTSNHGKRVAYMSVCMAEKMGVSDDALRDLAACALLHDNALTQYINEEFYSDISNIDTLKVSSDDITPRQLGTFFSSKLQWRKERGWMEVKSSTFIITSSEG